IYVAALWSKGDHAFHHSGPGLSPDQSGQWLLRSSNDNGHTWSGLCNITAEIKKPEWRLAFQGPGNGITMRNGILVFPAQYKDEAGTSFSTIVYSQDKGHSWQMGTGALLNTTEAAVAELSDGSLLLNMRDNRGDYRS
ncbi:exo-alpha-sialidase, partial [Hafnia paralvei]|uniref:exo-alpha-sialidase n=1 Tax=Hafnia paralvei TaxID=546367 RepID=UPI0038D07C84